MPRDTTTIDLEAEREDLIEARDSLVQQASQQEAGSEAEAALQNYGSRVDSYIDVVEHLIQTVDEEIVLAELSVGEQAKFTDAVEQAKRQAAETKIGGITPGSGTRRNYHVAACLHDSPWTSPEQGLQERVSAITDEDGPHPDVIDWLEHKATQINSLSEGNSKSFGARVRATRAQSGPK